MHFSRRVFKTNAHYYCLEGNCGHYNLPCLHTCMYILLRMTSDQGRMEMSVAEERHASNWYTAATLVRFGSLNLHVLLCSEGT